MHCVHAGLISSHLILLFLHDIQPACFDISVRSCAKFPRVLHSNDNMKSFQSYRRLRVRDSQIAVDVRDRLGLWLSDNHRHLMCSGSDDDLTLVVDVLDRSSTSQIAAVLFGEHTQRKLLTISTFALLHFQAQEIRICRRICTFCRHIGTLAVG